MLLFSTMLDINDDLTEKDFIQLLIDANQDHPHHPENIIPLEEMQWDHEQLENTFGDEAVSLQTEKYRNGEIMAAKFEKNEENGMSWETDYVWNLLEEKMSIRLSRTYSDDATTREQTFYTPTFIKHLIEKGFVKDDNGLPVSETPIIIDRDIIPLLVDAINGNVDYQFPIVYVSKKLSDNQNPVDVDALAKRLRGVAHVFVEEDNQLDIDIVHQIKDKQAFDGAVTVYYPNNVFENKMINRRHGMENDSNAFIDRILGFVLDYMNSRELPDLYTWDSVDSKITDDQLEHNRKERAKERLDKEEMENSWAKEALNVDKLKRERDELKRKVSTLENENRGLREKTKATDADIILDYGEEEEFFNGEAKEIVLDALEEVLPNYKTGERKRRYDILKSIVEGNERPDNLKKIYEELKTILNSADGKIEGHERELNKFSITIGTDRDGHPGYVYHENQDYCVTQASTGGDKKKGGHGPANAADEFKKIMF